MTWTSFIVTLILAYLVYYGLNLFLDLLIGRKPATSESENEVLFFEENNAPEAISYKQETEPEPVTQSAESDSVGNTVRSIAPGLLDATGAVGLKQLFNLAKDDLIEYTKAIPY